MGFQLAGTVSNFTQRAHSQLYAKLTRKVVAIAKLDLKEIAPFNRKGRERISACSYCSRMEQRACLCTLRVGFIGIGTRDVVTRGGSALDGSVPPRAVT